MNELIGLLSGEPSPDGRAARSHRSQRSIIEALRELHTEGDLHPTAKKIAERAGVSLRTVWQHFDDLEALLIAAARRDVELVLQLVSPTDTGRPLAERISWLVEQRVLIFERMVPGWRAARLQEPFSEGLRRSRERMVWLGQAELATLFAPELNRLAPVPRRRLLESLLAVTLWPFWDSLRVDLRLAPEQAGATIATMLTASFEVAGLSTAE
ncbi:TetR/AcrR family transcriptional regulator [Actinomadura opuntiae]|uniref:TetR/AcrR family transcriptional regulator n=1 Tax=Actinomadura sp. OS1-43 TaxID=604315 RepID=UPI00255A8C06|nr:TetR/AcrR family transcriptional regulator [Actinomadura sp. OS1-43]MDL4818520.1 TetR/AcrR family transcriptional regulator [Actinomadura sp. OS1-43]